MTREAKLADIKQDLAEFNKLLQVAQRPRIKQILSKQITILNGEQQKIQRQIQLQNKKSQQPQVVPQKIQTKQQTINTKASVNYTALTKYSYEDESKKIKIYFSLDNIATQCPAESIDVQFKPHSVQLRIRNYKKQNLLFSIKKTYGEIVPEQSKYVVKANLITLTLAKKSSGTWTQLNFKQDKFKPAQKEDISDPNASLMNMMKQMYQDGDQNMKKTIAQAWTKSKDKTGKDAFNLD